MMWKTKEAHILMILSSNTPSISFSFENEISKRRTSWSRCNLFLMIFDKKIKLHYKYQYYYGFTVAGAHHSWGLSHHFNSISMLPHSPSQESSLFLLTVQSAARQRQTSMHWPSGRRFWRAWKYHVGLQKDCSAKPYVRIGYLHNERRTAGCPSWL